MVTEMARSAAISVLLKDRCRDFGLEKFTALGVMGKATLHRRADNHKCPVALPVAKRTRTHGRPEWHSVKALIDPVSVELPF